MDDAAARSNVLDDEAIITAIQHRDQTALATLYDQYGGLALGVAYRILGERGAAEDVVQEAFLAVWRRADSFHIGRGTLRSWLMAIVHNGAIDRRRGRHRRELEHVDIDSVAYRLQTSAEDTFASVAETLDAEQVRRAITGLPVDQRHAIELAYFSGLTHQEIADQTDTPLGTVKSRLRLGLHKLRGELVDIVGDREPSQRGPGQAPA
jgi:RNA polymerase sigma-70 factor (ECF subfamily)